MTTMEHEHSENQNPLKTFEVLLGVAPAFGVIIGRTDTLFNQI